MPESLTRPVCLLTLALVCVFTCAARAADEPPSDWVDPATGHRVIRLSAEPGTSSLYFHQNAYTADGDKMLVTTRGGLATIDLTTLGTKPPKVEQIAEGRAGSPIVGRKTREVFYSRGRSIFATHLDTKATREVAQLPAGYGGASGLAVNADETLLASTGSDPKARELAAAERGGREGRGPSDARNVSPVLPAPATNGRGEGSRSMVLFTVNTKTGEVKPVHYSTSWLNHTQFSPTDPAQLLFAHEGDWHSVDRVWTIRTDGTGLKLLHPRTMDYEIAGHEFFGFDGRTVWYDLQTPRSKQFWLAGVDLKTGERLRYPIERSQWSVHYNQSHDGKLFSGDGGGPNSVANRTPLPEAKPLDPPGNGQWIYLFTPKGQPPETMKVGDETVKVGHFDAEKLVDLSNHDYRLEPNCTFSPDNRWIIFRSNLHGPTHVYAVEVKKSR